MLDHLVTVRDVLVAGGILVFIGVCLGLAFKILLAMNSDI